MGTFGPFLNFAYHDTLVTQTLYGLDHTGFAFNAKFQREMFLER